MKFRLVATDTNEENPSYDLVIVGGGPAGLSAALYAARYKLRTIVITRILGGLVNEATLVDDYLGIPGIPGNELVKKFANHVRKYGVPIVLDEVADVSRKGRMWCATTRLGRTYCGYAIILAIGSEKRKLNVPGERELLGRGVSYCATCDGPLFKNKVVAVVGGGNSALLSALYLASLAKRVILIHRRNEFRAFPIYVEKIMGNPKIEVYRNYIVEEIMGSNRVEAIKVKNRASGEAAVINVDGVFIEIGLEPPTGFFKKIGIEVDEKGFARVNPDMSTNLPGIFVAGDAAGGPCKYRFEQIVTAVADGAKAADAAFKYIVSLKKAFD